MYIQDQYLRIYMSNTYKTIYWCRKEVQVAAILKSEQSIYQYL